MKAIKILVRFLISPFFMVLVLLMLVKSFFLSWFHFTAYGGEFIPYTSSTQRNTISDIYNQLKEIVDEE